MNFNLVKWPVLPLFFFLCGCGLKVDTDPSCLFEEVRQEVVERSDYTPDWNRFSVKSYDCIEHIINQGLTLDRAVCLALFNNRHLQAVYENLGIAKADLAQAGLLHNPILDFSYRFSTRNGVTDLIDISLLHNFLEMLLIPLKKKMAREELAIAKNQVMNEILEVIAETKAAYVSLAAAELIRHYKKQLMEAAECGYDAAERLYKAGNLIILEVEEKRMEYEQAKVRLAKHESKLIEERERLNQLMGLWRDQIRWRLLHPLLRSPFRGS